MNEVNVTKTETESKRTLDELGAEILEAIDRIMMDVPHENVSVFIHGLPVEAVTDGKEKTRGGETYIEYNYASSGSYPSVNFYSVRYRVDPAKLSREELLKRLGYTIPGPNDVPF